MLTSLAAVEPPLIAEVTSEQSPDGTSVLVVRCVLPLGVKPGPNKYGMGVFATRSFAKGEVLYTGTYAVIADDGLASRTIRLETNEGTYPMVQSVHSVGVGNNERHLFTFDGFMNHSCEPNTYSADMNDSPGLGGSYKTVALREITSGDEVTCDYDTFELDAADKGIDKCECGASVCRGSARGFKFVPEDKTLAMLPKVYDEVINEWLKINPRIMYRHLVTPVGVAVRSKNEGKDLWLVAAQDFEPGDVLFEYRSEYFKSSDYDRLLANVDVVAEDEPLAPSRAAPGFWTERTRLVVELPFLTHTVNRGSGSREFYHFDSFCNHSCCPNAAFDIRETNLCRTTAVKHIKKGEAITNDYASFDEELDGTVFECMCGETNCRKIIKG